MPAHDGGVAATEGPAEGVRGIKVLLKSLMRLDIIAGRDHTGVVLIRQKRETGSLPVVQRGLRHERRQDWIAAADAAQEKRRARTVPGKCTDPGAGRGRGGGARRGDTD